MDSIVVALVSSFGAVIIALITLLDHRQNGKVDEIRVQVNGRLSEALDTIKALEKTLEKERGTVEI